MWYLILCTKIYGKDIWEESCTFISSFVCSIGSSGGSFGFWDELVPRREVASSFLNIERSRSFPCLFLILRISNVGSLLSLLGPLLWILFAGNTLTTTVSFSPTIADISGGNSDLLFCLINLSAVLPISDVPLSSKSLNSSSQVPSVPYRDILYLFTV